MKKRFYIQPAQFKLDGGAMFGIIPKPLWNKVAPADELNRIDLALRLYVIQEDDKIIVVDTGIGDHHGEKFDERFGVKRNEQSLKQAIESLGFNCDQVTDLVISHLHFDHVGGLGHAGHPVFDKATIHIHKEHYEYSKNPTMRDGGSFHSKDFLPLIEYYVKNNQIQWHSGEQGTLISLKSGDLNFITSNGHTPHMMHPYDEKIIYLADIVPTSNHLSIPWVMGYDIAPGVSTEDKKRILKFVAEKDLTILYEHDPKYWGSKIVKDERKGYIPHGLMDATMELSQEIKD